MGQRSITLTEAAGAGRAVAYDGALPASAATGIAGITFSSGSIGDVVNLFTPGEAAVPGVAHNAMSAGAFLVAQTTGALSGSNAAGDLTTGQVVVGFAEHAVTTAGDVVRFTFAPLTVAIP
jgi:hypothetical protein